MALPKAIANALNKRIEPQAHQPQPTQYQFSHVDLVRLKYDGRIPDGVLEAAQRLDEKDAQK
tara:strand:+ start:551 stop:736 length:186 start_codon:yes stop_codon:yes gene_type:complete